MTLPSFTDKLILKALEKYWERTAMREVCLRCIRAERHTGGFRIKDVFFWGGGCCNGCSRLGERGCTDKPVSCGVWMCGPLQAVFPEEAKFLKKMVRLLLGRSGNPYYMGFTPMGVREHVEIPRGNKGNVLVQIESRAQ
jgi:hypothetical protein